MAGEIMIELQDLSNKVNETVNYVNEYKKSGMKANSNDIMTLYKIMSEYEKKLSEYMHSTSQTTGTNNGAQYIDLVARREDARDNKRLIGEFIADSMKAVKFDAKKYENILRDSLTSKERNKQEANDLLTALARYEDAMKESKLSIIKKVDAKLDLIDACARFVKNSGYNTEAISVAYDIVAIMGEQNVNAFSKLEDEDLKKLVTRRNIGYQNKVTGKYQTFNISLKFAPNEVSKETELLLEKIGNMSQEEKEKQYEAYLMNLYGNDRFAKFSKEDRAKVENELGPEASEEARNKKLGELEFKRMPWNNIKLDDTVTSKDKFAKRQEVMRQWFPDDTKLLFGATAKKNKARNFYNVLTNGTYNGFFRSLRNSPEYTALIGALSAYTKNVEIDSKKDDENLEAVKAACVKYINRFEKKKDKSNFAVMRKEKVSELLNTLEDRYVQPERVAKKTISSKKETLTSFNRINASKPANALAVHTKSKHMQMGMGK